MSSKPRFLGIVYEVGNFHPLLKIAEYGRETGQFETVIWSPHMLPGQRSRVDACNKASVLYVEEHKNGIHSVPQYAMKDWLGREATEPTQQRRRSHAVAVSDSRATADQILTTLTPELIQEVFDAEDANFERASFCENWLLRLGIDVVIFAEDSVLRNSHCWISAAQKTGALSFVISYAALSSTEFEDAFKDRRDLQIPDLYRQSFRDGLGKWVREGPEYCITPLPISQVLGRERFGGTPFDPWLVNTHATNGVIVESEAMACRYNNFGFPRESIHALGHPAHDELFSGISERDVLRKELGNRFDFDHSLPIIAVGMPPDQTYKRTSSVGSFSDTIHAFAKLPTELTGLPAIVSPHPNFSDEHKQELIQMDGNLFDEPMARLLPIADIYITCVSSTIKWALALGLPIIDFDCFGYRYDDYEDLSQVRTVETLTDYKDELSKLADQDARKEFSRQSQVGSIRWGVIDGNAIPRIVDHCLGRLSDD